MAAFVVNVNEFPFTHLRITCPIPRKPIISTCAGTDARVSAKETCLLCRARRRKTKLTDEEPANRRTSERKRSLLVLPSEREENRVNCASECIRPLNVTRRSLSTTLLGMKKGENLVRRVLKKSPC